MANARKDWGETLERLAAGDRLAFLELNRLVTGCLVQLRAYDFRDEWEDLRQEVVLSVFRNFRDGKLRDDQGFVAYVRSITRNKFYDRLGRQEQRREKQTVSLDESAGSAAVGVVAADGDGLAGDVWLAVDDLPEQHQQVLRGVYQQGMTYEQVAGATGIPLGTVKRRLRQGLMTLRERLSEKV